MTNWIDVQLCEDCQTLVYVAHDGTERCYCMDKVEEE